MNSYLNVFLIIFAYYLVLFIIGQIKKDNSIVDMVWGLGFVIAAWVALIGRDKLYLENYLVTGLVSIWGLRLTYHITKRNLGKGEDFRYVNFREKWGNKFVLLKAFLHVYMLQMIMLFMIASSFIYTNIEIDGSQPILAIVGAILWLIGFTFEAVSDYQLSQFKQNKSNKGKILTTGLYKYSRHPNYFGEALLWWGIYVVGLGVSGGFLTIISPLTITILVRFVSGVPMLEKHYENREAYQVYAAKTSIFIPKRPKGD